jgi:thioesterase domain-containing protein
VTRAFEDRLRDLPPHRRQLLERMLAARSRPGDAPAEPGPVVLRTGTGPVRLVLVHPSGGEVFCYVPLTRALCDGIPVLGFRSHPADRVAPVDRQVAAVATRVLAALRRDDDPGRCVLAGWSYGGSVAFETARRCAEQGAGTPPVVLLDPPYLDTLTVPIPTEGELRAQFAYDLARLQGVPPDRLARLLEPSASAASLDELLGAVEVQPALTASEVEERYRTFAANASALHRYRPPSPYPGPVYLLTAGPEPEITAGWRRSTAGPFHHVALPGDHYTVFDAEQLPVVVRTVERAVADHRRKLEAQP